MPPHPESRFVRSRAYCQDSKCRRKRSHCAKECEGGDGGITALPSFSLFLHLKCSFFSFKDNVPYEDYAIQKVLRKSIQDCSHPLTASELNEIRSKIQSPYAQDTSTHALPLTEAELDEAIRIGAAPHWKVIRKLAHVSVAWKMRLQVLHAFFAFHSLTFSFRTQAVRPCLESVSNTSLL